ncbi:hypothetical protein [Streptomyces sp. NPDC048248]
MRVLLSIFELCGGVEPLVAAALGPQALAAEVPGRATDFAGVTSDRSR